MATPKVPLTITYRHAGTQPPIFIAGEFSEPPWDPQEMEYTTDEDGEHTFKKQVFAPANTKVQYKFRVGLGDWWVLNEKAPTAMDAAGFLNNVAEVPAVAEPLNPAAVAEKAKKIAAIGSNGTQNQNQKNDESRSSKEPEEQPQKEPTLADAAKELRHRVDLHSESGAGTPDFVKTTTEVADSAALLDNEDDKEDKGPPVANAAKEFMKRADPHAGSGRGTPDFVRTAAEVADSAALLDPEDAEPDVSDGEAGRTGLRRLSQTPIQDVAATAAEVADTAEGLDTESIPRLEVAPADYDAMDPYGFDDPSVPDNKAPLFAHECVGMELYEGDDPIDPLDEEQHSPEYEEDRRPSTVYDADEDIDLNDPTLEKFPSNREEIIDTVRKLEGGLNEDRSDVDGLIPLSPVVGPSGPQNHDLVGDFLVSSPAVASPIMPRGSGSGSRLLGLPRASLGSVSSDRSSALSLGSISEAEEAGNEDEAVAPPILSTPKPRQHPLAKEDPKSPTSDDDEGIVMKTGTDKTDKSREVSSNEDTPVRTPGDRTPKTTELQTKVDDHDLPPAKPELRLDLLPAADTSTTQAPDPASGSTTKQEPEPASAQPANGESSSPCFFDQPESSTHETENHTQEEEETTTTSPPTTSSNPKSSQADTGNQLRRRHPPPDRVATPSSINEAGMQAAKSGNWFRSFFKMIFVDWIGGFISRLCGGRRET
ncbi:hypothetical protein GE09DRAFT_1218069 [Coniochaeta sp. 2T2.1]|nr:hypothetical protein GE09DRAFT_1218069 [Coniochaeta sp. 2T2.1]